MNRFSLFFFIVLFFKCILFGQNNDSAWVYTNYTKQEVKIRMRDGIHLFTTVYAPKNNAEKHPVLMMRTPYSCAPYGENVFSTRLYKTYWLNYLKEGYIIVTQDVRGKYMSEGVFEDVRPLRTEKNKTNIDESTDTYDAINWLVKNIPHNNGNVGVFGISYPGFYSTMAAASNHPNLKAVSPQAPVTEWFMGDDFHHNGAFALMDAFSFYSSFGLPRPEPTTKSLPGFKFPNKDNYEFFLNIGAFQHFEKLFSDSVRFWKQLAAHPNYDGFWQERDARKAAVNLKPAMLVVGGLFDAEDCYGAWNLYKAIEKQSPQTDNRIVMGPWSHGGWSRGDGSSLGNIRFAQKTSPYYQENIEAKFFNYHLKSKGDLKELSEATIFFTGENKWHFLESWPPKNTISTPLFLTSDGGLSFKKPENKNAFTTYISDPQKPVPYTEDVHLRRTKEYMTDDQRFAARRTDVLTFKSAILENDITLAGEIKTFIKAMISTTDIDFVVKLIDVFPDSFSYDSSYCCKGVSYETEMAGYQMLVRGEIMRGRYRKSFEKPEAFKPEKIEDVSFYLPDVAHTFKKGHRLMIQIQSSWFPLFDRNPQQFIDIYTCNNSDFIKSEVKVFHDADNSSYIEIPVLKK